VDVGVDHPMPPVRDPRSVVRHPSAATRGSWVTGSWRMTVLPDAANRTAGYRFRSTHTLLIWV
jgi:hypothetical protein